MQTIGQARDESNDSKGKNIKKFAGGFYQSKEWRRFREKDRQIKRKKHEKIVMDVYRENPENDPADLIEFIYDDKKYPLSQMSLRDGIMKRANTLDHIREIKFGGAKFAHSNVQWLTAKEHYIKSQQEKKHD